MVSENWIAQLNEHAQKTRSELKYEDVAVEGPDHIKVFTLRVVLNGKAFPVGTGHNKKEARQQAAKNAMKALSVESTDFTEDKADPSPAVPLQTTSINYISWLNEYGNKNRVLIKLEESTTLEAKCCRFVVGGKEYPEGYGKTKKEAKEEAARLVYHEILGNKSTEPGDKSYGGAPQRPGGESKWGMSDTCSDTKSLGGNVDGENFVGLINNYCQQMKYPVPDYILVERCGEAHCPQFSYKLVINKKEYAVGKGKSVKEAKQNAAQQTWMIIHQQSDWDSKAHVLSDDVEPARPPTEPSQLDSHDAQSKCSPATTGDSAVFSSSPQAAEEQNQTPDVRPKFKSPRIAANFSKVRLSSIGDMPNFKLSKTASRETTSRFKSGFDCVEPLGKGTFGFVYKAREKLLNKCFAVKIVRCKDIAASLREVGALSDLLHTNIVRYYTCWMEDSGYQTDGAAESACASELTVQHLYIQMELCDTKTLRIWIDEKNADSESESSQDSKIMEKKLTIALQLARGVEYIHSKKFIHRDLKPANILFGRDEDVKIGDFGLVTDDTDDAENLTVRTVYTGTPFYMAPEQKSSTRYDRKVDIFALGLIYFELFWKLPGESKLIWEEARNQKLPQEFCRDFHLESRIVKSMLSFNPGDRPGASYLKEKLEMCTQANTCDERQTV